MFCVFVCLAKEVVLNNKNFKQAFTILELMFMLVAVSVMLAAFAPIAIKKISNSQNTTKTYQSYLVDKCSDDSEDNPMYVSDYCLTCDIDTSKQEGEEGWSYCVQCILNDEFCSKQKDNEGHTLSLDPRACDCVYVPPTEAPTEPEPEEEP